MGCGSSKEENEHPNSHSGSSHAHPTKQASSAGSRTHANPHPGPIHAPPTVLASTPVWVKQPNPWPPHLDQRYKQLKRYENQAEDANKAVRIQIEEEKIRYRAVKPTLPEDRKIHIGRDHAGLPARAQYGIAAGYKTAERRNAQAATMRSSVLKEYPYGYESQAHRDSNVIAMQDMRNAQRKARKNKKIRYEQAHCEQECHKNGYP